MNVSTSWPTPQLPRHEMTDNFSYIGIVPKITSITREELHRVDCSISFIRDADFFLDRGENFLSFFLSSKEIDDLPSFFFLRRCFQTSTRWQWWQFVREKSTTVVLLTLRFDEFRIGFSVNGGEEARFTSAKKSWDVSTILRMLRKFCKNKPQLFLHHTHQRKISRY